MQALPLSRQQVTPLTSSISQIPTFESRRKAINSHVERKHFDSVDLAKLSGLFQDESLDQCEAEALFALDAALSGRNLEFDALFISLVCQHIVWDLRPTGVVNEAQGEWLVRQCDLAQTPARTALLSAVLAEAHRVPGWFAPVVKARCAASQRAKVSAP